MQMSYPHLSDSVTTLFNYYLYFFLFFSVDMNIESLQSTGILARTFVHANDKARSLSALCVIKCRTLSK